ncbi:MAG: hypothetical protein AAB886_01655, partial [Patescibacteria group bacterium]
MPNGDGRHNLAKAMEVEMNKKGFELLQGGASDPSGTNTPTMKSPVLFTAAEAAKALVKNLATARSNRVEVSQDFHGVKFVAHANGELVVVLPDHSLTLTRQEVSRLVAKGLELAKSSKSDIAIEFGGVRFAFGRKGNLSMEWVEETKVSAPVSDEPTTPTAAPARHSFLAGLGSGVAALFVGAAATLASYLLLEIAFQRVLGSMGRSMDWKALMDLCYLAQIVSAMLAAFAGV